MLTLKAASLGSILLGAAILTWPAPLNLYPILFSDTGGLLAMGIEPSMGWDKPFVYGPLLALLHWRTTLWLPLAAQGLLLSYVLWLTPSTIARPQGPVPHVIVCCLLAIGSAAPWVAATLMPDLFTPVAILCLAVVGFGAPGLGRRHLLAAGLIAAVAIAAHLSNLIVACCCIAVIGLLQRALPWRPLSCLAAALAFLFASNWIGHGTPGISPYGSVFALARLVADGPARDYLDRVCPDPAYGLCEWRAKLGPDSDQFLWDPAGPFQADPRPLPAFAAEAAAIVSKTLAAYPLRVAADAIGNATRQLGRLRLGDTLVPDYLDATMRPRLAAWFPPAELRRYEASKQVRGLLAPLAELVGPVTLAGLALGAAASVSILARGLRRPSRIADLTALILLALAANAFATGALSTVHDRYQVRVAWLVLVVPALLAAGHLPLPLRRRVLRPRPGT